VFILRIQNFAKSILMNEVMLTASTRSHIGLPRESIGAARWQQKINLAKNGFHGRLI
jgi:hypothetical protein